MPLEIVYTSQFKQDYKRVKKQGFDLKKLELVIGKLANREDIEQKYRDHPLKGKLKGHRECHIEPDWLLIYRIDGDELLLAGTGSHAYLFGM